MAIRAVLFDLDGTLTSEDMLDVVCEITGKRKESEELSAGFHTGKSNGTNSLFDRVNLLRGVSVGEIHEKLRDNPYLRPGAEELADYVHHRGLITAIQSRNILPVLEYYQKALGIGAILGTALIVEGGVIQGIFEKPELKYDSVVRFLSERGIPPEEALAFGDSRGDKRVFALVGKSIAVNPSDGLEGYATEVIYNDLIEAIPIIEGW
ncbi:MAG: HAD-IB family phosphatase [archaeon]